MKYCVHCGAALDDNVRFCTSCGQKPEAEAPAGSEPAAAPAASVPPVAPVPPAYSEQVSYEQPVQPVYEQKAEPRASLVRPIVGLALGIAGLSFSIVLGLYGLFGLIGVGISIAGLIVSSKAKQTNPGSNMAAHGFKLSLAGIIVGGVLTIIFTIIWGALGISLINN